MRRGEKSGSSGSNGLNGILKKECNVCPPTLTAAMPVGASTTCSLLVLAQMYFRNVLFPVPALPVRNTDRRVLRIRFHAFWNSKLSRSIFVVHSCVVKIGSKVVKNHEATKIKEGILSTMPSWCIRKSQNILEAEANGQSNFIIVVFNLLALLARECMIVTGASLVNIGCIGIELLVTVSKTTGDILVALVILIHIVA